MLISYICKVTYKGVSANNDFVKIIYMMYTYSILLRYLKKM